MERISIKANLIVSLRDSYKDSTNLKGVVSVRSHNGVTASAKADGCFVFINCPKGLYKIFVEGSCYQPQSFDVVMDDTVQIRYLSLMPNRKYVFSDKLTKLSGKLDREVYMAFQRSVRDIRILEYDKTEPQKVKLFFENEGDVVGRQFDVICHGKHYVNMVVDGHSESRWYVFEEPLPDELDVTAEIWPVYRCVPDEDGMYFMAVRGIYERVYVLEQEGEAGIHCAGDFELILDDNLEMILDIEEEM